MLGSVIASIDAGSGAVSKIGYLPYGKSGTTPPFGFTAQRIDPETGGLYYYRARHYSPAWGRFMQPDPIGYAGGSNLYAYVGNDPLNFNDPNGLVKEALAAAATDFYNQTILKAGSDIAGYFNDAIRDPAAFAQSSSATFGALGGIAGKVPGAISGAAGAIRAIGSLGFGDIDAVKIFLQLFCFFGSNGRID
jgi:RHS repeat-associated protein